MNWMSSTGSYYPWRNIDDTTNAVDFKNLQSTNGVLRNTQMIYLHQLPDYCKSYESGFTDSLNAHNSYFHCQDLGHFNSICVRSENTNQKNVVSTSFGYLIIDSVVAPHDRMDVSRQLIETIQFSFKGVFGNTINIHGAHCSFSLIFATMD